MANRVLVHQTNIASRLIIQIIFIISAATLDDLTNGGQDGIVEGLPLVGSEIVKGMFWIKTGAKQNILCNGIS